MLDRDAHSYSEFKTFASSCKLQHFYRYYMQLEGARFQDVQYFIIGRIVHQAIEMIYDGAGKESAVNATAQSVLMDMRDEILNFDRDAFEIKRRVARNMVDIFVDEVRPEEPYEIEDTELYFEEDIAGIPFRGHVDRIYQLALEDARLALTPSTSPGGQVTFSQKGGGYEELLINQRDEPEQARKDMQNAIERAEEEDRDFLRFIGEEKTRSSSSFPSASSYEQNIKEDLQTHLYMAGLEKAGMPIDGIVHTSYRKAPSKYRKMENYDSLGEQKEAIDGYYERSRSPMRRVQMVWRPPDGVLESHLRRVQGDMEEFYQDPFQSVDEFIKHDPERYPCAFCSYRRICHGDDEIDEGFRYKTK